MLTVAVNHGEVEPLDMCQLPNSPWQHHSSQGYTMRVPLKGFQDKWFSIIDAERMGTYIAWGAGTSFIFWAAGITGIIGIM